MILQFGLRSQIENIVAVIAAHNPQARQPISGITQLAQDYRMFIERYQGRKSESGLRSVNIITDRVKAKEMSTTLSVNELSVLDDLGQDTVFIDKLDTDKDTKATMVAQAIDEIKKYSEEHRALFDAIITDIFIMPSERAVAGSVSHALGIIWANPRVTFSVNDVVELLIHEMVHHTMFLDELRYGHYEYEQVMTKDNWAKSAILHTHRPLDKVLHSIVVSTEILLLRERFLGHPAKPRHHPPTSIMLSQINDSIDSIESSIAISSSRGDQPLKNRGLDVLRIAKEAIASLGYSAPAHSGFSMAG